MNYLINCTLGAEKMVQQLRAPAALEEDLCLVPSTHKAAHHHL